MNVHNNLVNVLSVGKISGMERPMLRYRRVLELVLDEIQWRVKELRIVHSFLPWKTTGMLPNGSMFVDFKYFYMLRRKNQKIKKRGVYLPLFFLFLLI